VLDYLYLYRAYVLFYFFHLDYVVPILCASVARQKGLVNPWLMSRAKIPMTRTNESDLLLKRTKKVKINSAT